MIDFQKSGIEKYIVKNVITQDVVSLYTDLLQKPTWLTAGKQGSRHSNLDNAEWERSERAPQMNHFQGSNWHTVTWMALVTFVLNKESFI